MRVESEGRSPLERVLGGTVYTGVGTGLGLISGIIATKILATHLSSQVFGTVVLIELVAQFLRMISGFGVGVAAIRALTDAESEKQKTVVNTVVIFRLVTLVCVALLFLVTQQWVYRLFGEAPADNVAVLILAFTVVLAYQGELRQMLQGFLRFRQMALIDLVASILNVALLGVLLLGFHMGLAGAVVARIVAAGTACVLCYLCLPTRKGLSFHLGTLRDMLRFSWPLQINDLLTFGFSSFGTLVVAAVMTPQAVALMAIASKIPSNVSRLFESFRTVYFPNLTRLIQRGEDAQAQEMLNSTLRIVAFVLSLGAMVVLVFQRQVIVLLFSEQYLNIGPLLTLAMFSLSIALVGNVLGTSSVAAGSSKAPPVCNTVNTILVVPGTLLLVPILGVNGAIIARTIGDIVTNPVNVWFLRRASLPPKVMDYVKPLLLSGTLSAAYLWLQPESGFVRTSFLVVFILMSFLLSIVRLGDVHALRTVLAGVWERGRRKRVAVRQTTAGSVAAE